MKRNIVKLRKINLIEKIIDFGFKYEIFDKTSDIHELRSTIADLLSDTAFVEDLINTIIIKTRKRSDINAKEIKYLLIGLESIRIDLEHKDYVA